MMRIAETEGFYYWRFIEDYYPNYYSCNDILLSDILTRKLCGEEISQEDELMIRNWDVKAKLLELDKSIFSKAFESYFEFEFS